MSERVFSFDPASAPLPDEVVQRAQAELADWRGSRMPASALSPRGTDFLALDARVRGDLRTLLAVPDAYEVLLLPGGVTLQQAGIALNLLPAGDVADYVVTGEASAAAAAEAGRFGAVNVIASAHDHVPDPRKWRFTPDAAYLHIALDDVASGVAFDAAPVVGAAPLVAEASLALCARPLHVARFGVLYASAHAGLGAHGLAIVVVRRDFVGHARTGCPSALDFGRLAGGGPPDGIAVSAVHLAGLMVEWLLARNGLAGAERDAAAKAALLYAQIDRSGFYANPVRHGNRSTAIVPFALRDERLRAAFLAQARERGLVGLARDAFAGPLRAAIYNGMPVAGVQALADHLRDFERSHG